MGNVKQYPYITKKIIFYIFKILNKQSLKMNFFLLKYLTSVERHCLAFIILYFIYGQVVVVIHEYLRNSLNTN
jgi:hypothetical protein